MHAADNATEPLEVSDATQLLPTEGGARKETRKQHIHGLSRRLTPEQPEQVRRLASPVTRVRASGLLGRPTMDFVLFLRSEV
jgi:hypothetical protein